MVRRRIIKLRVVSGGLEGVVRRRIIKLRGVSGGLEGGGLLGGGLLSCEVLVVG